MNAQANPYLIFLISAISEAIGYVCCNINDKVGRKRGFIFFLMTSSIFCLVVALLASQASADSTDNSMSALQITRIGMALFGKAMVSAAFNACYIYNSMLYPSIVRSSVLLLTSNLGGVGSYISPQINLLKSLWEPLPYFVFGSSSFLSATFIFIMPDPENKIHIILFRESH